MNIHHWIIKQFELLRDHFIPTEFNQSNKLEEAFRFQLLSGLILITIFLLSLFNFHYLFISQFKMPDNAVTLLFTGIPGGFHLLLLFNLKSQQSSRYFSHLFVASIFLPICLGIFFTGGSLNNSTSYFLNVPVITAFLLIGKSTGIIYAFLSFCFYITIALCEHSGIIIPQTIPLNVYATIEVMLWLFFSGTLVLFSIAYDHLTTQLTKQKQFEQAKQTYYATHDSLTQLANRHKFDQAFTEAFARAKRQKSHIGLYLIDLDGFKPINDQYGHDAGDALLKDIASNINQVLRGDDIAARIGGDEFAIITQAPTLTKDDIAQLSKRILHAIEKPLKHLNHTLKVSASIGIACYPDHGTHPETLMKAADIAMYSCKNTKDRWAIFTHQL